MIFKLVYTYRAIRDIKKLDTRIKERIGKTLLKYEEDLLKYAEQLTDHQLGTYRF